MKNPLRTCFVSAIAIAMLASSALAGQDASEARCGRQALQFQIASNFTLKGFNESLVAYQRFLSESRAIRLAASLDLSTDSIDESFEFPDDDLEGSSDMSEWHYDVRLQAQMLFYRGKGTVRPYYGAGPFLGYSSWHDERTSYYPADDVVEYVFYVDDRRSWKLGLVGTLGVEWAITENLAVHAEYKATAYYTFGDAEEKRESSPDHGTDYRTTTETSSPAFDSNGVLFGLSVYF